VTLRCECALRGLALPGLFLGGAEVVRRMASPYLQRTNDKIQLKIQSLYSLGRTKDQ
jgi:hypothetical protein